MSKVQKFITWRCEMEKKRNHLDGYGYNSDFPQRLRALMENKNNISPLKRDVSQTELAKAISVTRQAVSTYSLGTSVPDAIRLQAIANFFYVSSDYLLGLSSTCTPDTDIQGVCKVTSLDEKTINAILSLTKKQKDRFTFSQLVQTKEFSDIITAISAFLSIRWKNKVDEERVLAMDAIIQKESGGSMRVVHASTEKYLLLVNAQNYLADAIKLIDKKTAPPKEVSNGTFWRIEDET